jgi:hypothetical protein
MLTNVVATKLRGRLNALPVGRLTAIFAALQIGVPQVSQVPLPAAAVLFGSALVGLGVLGRRRKKQYPLLAI